jgi:hypothetical protein
MMLDDDGIGGDEGSRIGAGVGGFRLLFSADSGIILLRVRYEVSTIGCSSSNTTLYQGWEHRPILLFMHLRCRNHTDNKTNASPTSVPCR